VLDRSELNSVNRFDGFFELHRQRFIRQLKVQTDSLEKIALLLLIPFTSVSSSKS
jgi:hypothetical protein